MKVSFIVLLLVTPILMGCADEYPESEPLTQPPIEPQESNNTTTNETDNSTDLYNLTGVVDLNTMNTFVLHLGNFSQINNMSVQWNITGRFNDTCKWREVKFGVFLLYDQHITENDSIPHELGDYITWQKCSHRRINYEPFGFTQTGFYEMRWQGYVEIEYTINLTY